MSVLVQDRDPDFYITIESEHDRHLLRRYNPELYGPPILGPETCIECGMDRVHHPKCVHFKRSMQ